MSVLRLLFRIVTVLFNLALGLFVLLVGLFAFFTGEELHFEVVPALEGEALVWTLIGGGLLALIGTGLALGRVRIGALLMLVWNTAVSSILICAFTRSSYHFDGVEHLTSGIYLFLVSLAALWGSWIQFRTSGPAAS